ncbi:MAG: hypothetical protein IT368_15185 [Candidatus Hydrogenedentes bacterium]|nr:hypothetical protein [Candidatus Hydrogenedentota bacterium]
MISHVSPLALRILDAFPSGAYAMSGLLKILEIVETEEVPTAAVECRQSPKLLINPAFVERHADTSEKLLMLVMHELHHILLGHTRLIPRVTEADNIVFDAVINAMLCRMFPERESTAFFTDFYRDDAFPECLLRPPAGWSLETEEWPLPPALGHPDLARVSDIYRALYSPAGASYREVRGILRRLTACCGGGSANSKTKKRGKSTEEGYAAPAPGEEEGVLTLPQLIGGHDEEDELPRPGSALYKAVQEIAARWPDPPEPIRGQSLGGLLETANAVPRRIPSNRALLRSLLRKVGASKRPELGRVRVPDSDHVTASTPVLSHSRRSLVLRALGTPPLLHETEVLARRPQRKDQQVHIYLDVSGSIGDLKDMLYGAVLDCREFVAPKVHLFSTQVYSVSLKQLRQGECKSNFGTSIDCVAEHIRRNRVRRAVIITDGFVGPVRKADRETLGRVRLGVALTPGASRRDELAPVTNYWIALHAAP